MCIRDRPGIFRPVVVHLAGAAELDAAAGFRAVWFVASGFRHYHADGFVLGHNDRFHADFFAGRILVQILRAARPQIRPMVENFARAQSD